MSEDRRFVRPRGNPDEAFRGYHGAPLVDFVIRSADAWIEARDKAADGSAPRPVLAFALAHPLVVSLATLGIILFSARTVYAG